MKKLQGEKFQTIVKLPDGIKIQVNLLNWILFIPPRNYFYFATAEQLFDDLLDYRIKQHGVSGETKDMRNLKNAIEKTREEVLGIMQPLTTVKKDV